MTRNLSIRKCHFLVFSGRRRYFFFSNKIYYKIYFFFGLLLVREYMAETLYSAKKTLEERAFVESVLKMRCYMVKNTLFRTVFSTKIGCVNGKHLNLIIGTEGEH